MTTFVDKFDANHIDQSIGHTLHCIRGRDS